jgi:membrane protease YdiL (CAAX protease family)
VKKIIKNKHVIFWFTLIFFILFRGLVFKGFQIITSLYSFNNSTRSFYQNYLFGGISPVLHNFFFQGLPQLIIVYILCYFYLKVQKFDYKQALNFKFKVSYLKWIILGLMFVIPYQLFVCYYIKDNTPNSFTFSFNHISIFFLYLLRFFPSAFMEEITFRAGIYHATESNYNVYVGILLSLLMFGVSHLAAGWWPFTNSIILGFLFTSVFMKTRSFLPSAILHTLNNVFYACINYTH